MDKINGCLSAPCIYLLFTDGTKRNSTIYLTPSVPYYNHLFVFSEIAKERRSVAQSELYQTPQRRNTVRINYHQQSPSRRRLGEFTKVFRRACRENILPSSSHLTRNDKPSSADTTLPGECNCAARKQGKQAAPLDIHTGDSEEEILYACS